MHDEDSKLNFLEQFVKEMRFSGGCIALVGLHKFLHHSLIFVVTGKDEAELVFASTMLENMSVECLSRPFPILDIMRAYRDKTALK